MTALVISDSDSNAARAAVTAAAQMAGDVHLLFVGIDAAEAASITGISKLLHLPLEHPLAESLAPQLAAKAAGYSHLVAAATTFGKDVMPRVAALLDVAQISDITAVLAADSFTRPIYAGNALEMVQSSDAIKAVTVRATAFAKAATGGNTPVETLAAGEASPLSEFLGLEASTSDRPELTAARVVVSGGRALGSKENFTLIEQLADKLGAAVGASRAAVDAGYVPNDCQVGQTGKVVAPELYVAVGISGAIQHLAGMKESKVIVAINKDENAPIFEVADYGLVGDLFEVLPKLTAAL